MIGLVICHKTLAKELVETAKAIVGHTHDLYPFSNEKFTVPELVREIKLFIESKGNPEQVIFMVDLRGGNCWTVARMLAHNKSGYVVLSGVNLPMIFSFLTKKELLPAEDLFRTIEADAHRGISFEK
ncbi:MAG: hypothetical protein Kow0042_31700 [Calditrichia bacterium]